MPCYAVHGRLRRPIEWSRTWLIILLVLFPFVATADEGSEEVRRAVTGFYNTYVKARPQGIPQEKEMAKLRPYLSKALDQNLKQARQAEQQYQKANRGAVPPLIEGDLFTSLFEGATAFRLISCEVQKDVASCDIEFTSINPTDRSPFKWKDKVHLVLESRRWLIDDVEYRGNWEFMHKGRLKAVLRRAIEDSKK